MTYLICIEFYLVTFVVKCFSNEIRNCSESDGISQELLDKSDQAFYIEQLGSTRSINVGCASAVAMYEAVRQLGLLPKDA